MINEDHWAHIWERYYSNDFVGEVMGRCDWNVPSIFEVERILTEAGICYLGEEFRLSSWGILCGGEMITGYCIPW